MTETREAEQRDARTELPWILKSSGFAVWAQQECDCIAFMPPHSPAVWLQHSRSAGVILWVGTKQAITGAARSMTRTANNPNLRASFKNFSVNQFETATLTKLVRHLGRCDSGNWHKRWRYFAGAGAGAAGGGAAG